jgi:hypothetical protein
MIKLLINIHLILLMVLISSCVNDSSKKDGGSSGSSAPTVNPLKAVSVTPAAFNEDTSSVITLIYTDTNSRKALSCSLNTLVGVSISQACACSGAGVCTVGVAGLANFNGAASFRYNVAIGGEISSTANANFTITPVDDPPSTSSMTPAPFRFNTQSIITLSYVDVDGDKAASCALTALSNVTVTQACACNASGVCTVGVTGANNYIGAASFSYTVIANSVTSNSSVASLTIQGTPPVAANITPSSFPTNTQSIMTLSYTDAEGDQATTCSISGQSNVVVSRACACAAGVCTVGITSNLNFIGVGKFNYIVNAAGQDSNSATSTFTITANTPVAANITPAAFNEDVQSIITLSYTDPFNRKATACTISSASNITVTQACACDVAGICQVGVKGVLNYNGAASFNYTVTAVAVSNTATATLTINPVDDAPTTASVILPDIIYEDTASGFLTLNYTDVDGDRAGVNDCTISNPVNLTVTTACTCDVILGTCSLKVTGSLHYNGAASFDYKVKTTTLTSNVSTASVTITHKDHAPVSTNITPAAFNEDTQSIMTLAYTDIDSDKAATCTLSSLGNVTVTRACACDAAGVCTVGVTGTLNYNGAASFYYTVTANGATSNSSTSSFTINPVDDAPVATNISPPSFNENTQSIITLAYSDVDGDNGNACAISGLTNVTVTQACSCTVGGVCTVGVTGTLNYSGAASFNYTVTTTTLTSNSATATLAINFVNSAPTMTTIADTFGNQNTPYVVNVVINDIDGPLACSTAVTATTSSNTTLIPLGNIVFAGTYPNCTATITPANNQFGASSLTFQVTDVPGLSNSRTFIHTVRQSVTQTWLLGDVGDLHTYSYGSANIETVAPGIIQLKPFTVDQTDDDNTATGFTSLPSQLKWDGVNNKVAQNHAIGAWTLTSGVYSTTYTSRVLDAKKSTTWTALSWKTPFPYGKEIALTNESATDYSATNGTFANSLVGLWHFNETAGATTVKNSKTGTNDAFLINSTPATPGAVGKFSSALNFNGTSSVRSLTSAAVTPGAFTVSTWVQKSGATSEYVLCFFLTNTTTAATDCPVRISNVIRVRVANTSYLGTTVINDSLWHHLVVVSDSSGAAITKVYIDGVLETFGTNPPSFTTASASVYLGSNIGNAGSFTGTIDETAIWNRVFTVGEITELYRRGANRLIAFYRTCPDGTCSTNPAWSTQLSELDNISAGEAKTTAPTFVIAPTNQRYFQYKMTFESDDVPTTSAPDLENVTVGPVHYSYATTEEEFTTQEGLSFKSLSNFTETLGVQACSGAGGGVHYQLSKDNVSWSYYNGSVWGAGTNFATASTTAQIISGLPAYTSASNTVSDVVYIRAILKSDAAGGSPCEVNQLKLDGFQ